VRIAFFEVQDWEERFLREGFKGHEVKLFKDLLTEEKLGEVKDFEVVSIFIYSRITEEILSRLERLRLVATRSTGFDHVDIEACRKRRVLVSNVPAYSENTVAEHTFALILSLSRIIHDSYDRTRRGDFTCEGVQGFDLNGKLAASEGGL